MWRTVPDGDQSWPCSYGDAVGYVIDGEPETIALGTRYNLLRLNTPFSVPDSAVYERISLDIEMHYDYRLRIKVL